MTTVSTDAFDLQRIQKIRKWAIGLSLLAVVVLVVRGLRRRRAGATAEESVDPVEQPTTGASTGD